jgi:hypothetical protein
MYWKENTVYSTGLLHFGQRAENWPILPLHPQLEQAKGMLCFMGSDRLKNIFLNIFIAI